jgi:hypothetical protein
MKSALADIALKSGPNGTHRPDSHTDKLTVTRSVDIVKMIQKTGKLLTSERKFNLILKVENVVEYCAALYRTLYSRCTAVACTLDTSLLS